MYFSLVFLAIFAPFFKLDQYTVDLQAIFFIAIILYGAIWHKTLRWSGFFKLALTRILLILAVYGLLANLIYSISGFGDFQTFLRPVRALINFAGCFVIWSLFETKYSGDATGEIVTFVFYAISLHSLIMIYQFLDPAFRDYIYKYTASDRAINGARYFYSMAGLSNAGGSQLSVYQSFGVIIAPFFYCISPTKFRLVAANIFLTTCAVSVAMTGRSGLLVIGLFLPLILVYVGRNSVGRKFLNAFFVAIISFAFFGVIASRYLSFDSEEFINLSVRLLEISENINETTDELQSHYIFPADGVTLFFGNPKLVGRDQDDENRIVQSDLGYIRIIFGYGIIGSIFNYLFYLYILYISFKKMSPKGSLQSNVGFLSFILVIIIMIMQYKEVFVLTRIGFTVTCLLILSIDSARFKRVCRQV